MYRVIFQFKDGQSIEAKATTDILFDKVACLPWVVFEKFPTLLDKKDWARSQETIASQLERVCGGCIVTISTISVDGRKRDIKALKWFKWPDIYKAVQDKAVAAA